MANNKFYFHIMGWGESVSEGYVLLTKEEAQIVKFAVSEKNWKHADIPHYSGSISIDVNHPMTEEEMEADYKSKNSWDDEEDEEDSCSYANYYEYADKDKEESKWK